MGAGWGQINKERQAEINADRLREYPQLMNKCKRLEQENNKLRALAKRLLSTVNEDALMNMLLEGSFGLLIQETNLEE